MAPPDFKLVGHAIHYAPPEFLKNFLRSKMGQERLNALLLAELHPLIREDISPSFITTEFVSLNNERKIYYGHFMRL